MTTRSTGALARQSALALALAAVAIGGLEILARIVETPSAPPPAVAPGSLRVTAFGSSSVRGSPEPRLGFVSQLRFWLKRAGRPVEVENLGVPGLDSSLLLERVRHSMEDPPDLAIVHTGMGEFFRRDEVAGSRRFLRRLRESSGLVRLITNLPSLRAVARAATLGPSGNLAPYDRGSPGFQRKLERYERNLDAIVEEIRGHGVPLLLATSLSNLRDWRPVNLELADQLYPDGYDQRLRALGERVARRDAAVGEDLESELAHRPGDAMLHFLRGRALEQGGDYGAARESYYRARDLDPLPWRPTSRSNDAVRAFSDRDGVSVVDFERILEDAAEKRLTGFTFIVDGAHPTPEASNILAGALLKQIGERGFALDGIFSYSLAADPLEVFLEDLRSRHGDRPELEYLRNAALSCMKFPFLRFDQARRYLQLWRERAPENPAVWANLATVSFAEDEIARAEAELREALRLSKGGDPTAGAPFLAEAMERAGRQLGSPTEEGGPR